MNKQEIARRISHLKELAKEKREWELSHPDPYTRPPDTLDQLSTDVLRQQEENKVINLIGEELPF